MAPPPDDRDDDDHLDPGPVPAPDAEPTPQERARARAFADLVDKVVAGRPPAAMAADDRALVETATVIRASAGLVDLPPQRKSALVEAALRRAIDKPRGHETVPPVVRAETPAPAPVVPIEAARWKRRAPWVVAVVSTAVAAAAVIALIVRPPRVERAAPAAASAPAEHLRSRPADALVGVIPEERDVGAATAATSARIDAIFADRLDGYRELALGGR